MGPVGSMCLFVSVILLAVPIYSESFTLMAVVHNVASKLCCTQRYTRHLAALSAAKWLETACTYWIEDVRAGVPVTEHFTFIHLVTLQPVFALQHKINLHSVIISYLFVPCTRLRLCERAFSSTAARLWNALPTDIKLLVQRLLVFGMLYPPTSSYPPLY